MNTLVVLPSFNERENIIQLIKSLLALDDRIDICVVDDSSPDRTYELIQNFIKENSLSSRVNLIIRPEKDGRGGAVRKGLSWALASPKTYSAFVEMDCDFSHDPKELPKGLKLLDSYDVVIGARYPNGRVIGWPIRRKVFSALSNYLARFLISWKITDYTNGFRFYNRRAAELICAKPQVNKGYIYLSEMLSHFLKSNLKIATFPIVFVNRERGVSNTNLKEIRSALSGIFQIAWQHRFGK